MFNPERSQIPPVLEGLLIVRPWSKSPRLDDLERIMILAGSLDTETQGQALNSLGESWLLKPERSAEKAQKVDLMELSSGYSEAEIKLMCSECGGIQLTENCNGYCYFCNNFKKDVGITKVFTPDSIVEFFRRYGQFLPQNIMLYWDSDPFDHYKYLYLFDSVKKIRPELEIYTSTAIPPGSQRSVIKFGEYLFKQDANVGKPDILRVSVGTHNIRRVQTTMISLYNYLCASYPKAQVDNFFESRIQIDLRVKKLFGGILPIGPLIVKADPYKQLTGIACEDAVVFTPNGPKAKLLVCSDVYNSDGELSVDIPPNSANLAVPSVTKRKDYTSDGLKIADWCKSQIDFGKFFLPPAVLPSGEEYDLSKLNYSQFDQVVFVLSRAVLSLHIFLYSVKTLQKTDSVPPADKDKFFDGAKREYLEISERVKAMLARAKGLLQQSLEDSRQYEKLNHYISLLEQKSGDVNSIFAAKAG